jgi:hypothetical protein
MRQSLATLAHIGFKFGIFSISQVAEIIVMYLVVWLNKLISIRETAYFSDWKYIRM